MLKAKNSINCLAQPAALEFLLKLAWAEAFVKIGFDQSRLLWWSADLQDGGTVQVRVREERGITSM